MRIRSSKAATIFVTLTLVATMTPAAAFAQDSSRVGADDAAAQPAIEQVADEAALQAADAVEEDVELSAATFEYTYNSNKSTATVSKYNGSATKVTIPSKVTKDGKTYTVTAIGSDAFKGKGSITSVSFPSTLTEIGNRAFSGCSNLASLTLPTNLTSIRSQAFAGCVNLKSVIVYSTSLNNMYVNDSAFENAGTNTPGMTVTFASGCTNVPSHMFYSKENAPKVTSVTIGKDVQRVGQSSFENCKNLTNVGFAGTMCTEIDQYAFYACTGLKSIYLPDGLKTIKNYAFQDSAIQSIRIPDTVTGIGNYAFTGCTGLTGITLPASLTSLGAHSFSGCVNLANVSVKSTSLNDMYVNDGAFENAGTNTSGMSVTFASGCTNVPSHMFYSKENAPKVASVVFSKDVQIIGQSALENCKYLTEVTFEGSLCKEIGKYAFYSCTSLKTLTIPSSVTTIGQEAFYNCLGMESLTVPASVAAKNIGYHAFEMWKQGSTLIVTTQEQYDKLSQQSGSSTYYTPERTTLKADIKSSDSGNTNTNTSTNTNTNGSNNNSESASNGGSKTSPSYGTPTEDFAARLYIDVLDRDPDANGMNVQVNALNNGAAPAEIAFNYFASDEYAKKGESAEKTVERVYQVMFGRASDAAGKTMWVDAMNGGMTIRGVVAGFSQSQEYKDYFAKCNLNNATIGVTQPRDVNAGVTAFCGRLYTKCLNRAYDAAGANTQANAILNGMSASQIAVNYFISAEFSSQNLSNDEIVERCYQTMMNRASDAAGKVFWKAKMDAGMSVEGLVRGFAESAEWAEICARYGVNR